MVWLWNRKRSMWLFMCLLTSMSVSLLVANSFSDFLTSKVRSSSRKINLAFISQSILTFSPMIDQVYLVPQSDGGYQIEATGSLTSYSLNFSVVADVVSQFMYGVYEELQSVRVDNAGIALRFQGHYILMAGLGIKAKKDLPIENFHPDQGVMLLKTLQHIDRFTGPLQGQAFAQWQR